MMNLRAHATVGRIACLLFLVAFLSSLVPLAPVRAATQIDIPGPAGSQTFGMAVMVLPNGNFVVDDPGWDSATDVDVGAVYLYDGATAALISTLAGSHAQDHVGLGGVTLLANGGMVIASPLWDGERGAATWCSTTTGCSGTVSAANSLVGTTASDQVGWTVRALNGGAYVVLSYSWNNSGVAANAGAVTWCPGGPCIGEVSAGNSLVGDQAGDQVGWDITVLSNGHYVIGSPSWHDQRGAATWCDGTAGRVGPVDASNSRVGGTAGDQVGLIIIGLPTGAYLVESPYWDSPGTAVEAPVANVGAVTRCNGTATCAGTVSTSNSLVGSHAEDRVGYGATVLASGDYVLKSPYWNGEQGAASWCSGIGKCTGSVSASNSLVGSHAGDQIGIGVEALAKGHYVVHSADWNEGRGAITWCNGATGCVGVVDPLNSLVGSAPGDQVADEGALLTNGHYVVGSPGWSGGKGAATWCSGTAGCTGQINPSNSLVGTVAGDGIGRHVTALTNGHYVVGSPAFKNGAGAATWGSGKTGITGEVTAGNSLLGSAPDDEVGVSVTALTNGHYVVSAPAWDNGGAADAGAARWCDGSGGCVGTLSAANSLVGGAAGDEVGAFVDALTNGHYVVGSPYFDWSTAADAGAVTWCSGTSGCTGAPSIDNSLVGGQTGDKIGYYGGAWVLPNGHYALISPFYDRDGNADTGAVTPGFGWGVMAGQITASNSVRGAAVGGGEDLMFRYDPIYHQFLVGRLVDNMVTLFRWGGVYLPLITRES